MPVVTPNFGPFLTRRRLMRGLVLILAVAGFLTVTGITDVFGPGELRVPEKELEPRVLSGAQKLGRKMGREAAERGEEMPDLAMLARQTTRGIKLNNRQLAQWTNVFSVAYSGAWGDVQLERKSLEVSRKR